MKDIPVLYGMTVFGVRYHIMFNRVRNTAWCGVDLLESPELPKSILADPPTPMICKKCIRAKKAYDQR